MPAKDNLTWKQKRCSFNKKVQERMALKKYNDDDVIIS